MDKTPNNISRFKEFVFNSRSIIVVVSILFFIITGTAFWLVYQNAEVMRQQINDDFNQQQSILARQVASQIDAILEDIKMEVMVLKKLRSKNNFDIFKEQVKAMVERTGNKGVITVSILDSSGNSLTRYTTNNKKEPKITKIEEEIKPIKPGKVTLGPLKSEYIYGNNPIVTSTICNVITNMEKRDEFLYIKINISHLVKTVTNNIQSGKTGYAWVLDESGMFLYHPEDEFVGKNAFTVRKLRKPYITFTKINEIMKDRMLQGEEGTGAYISGWHRGIEREMEKLIAYTPIKSTVFRHGQRWSVGVVAPISEIENTVKNIYLRNFSVEAALIAVMFIFGLIVTILQNYMSRALTARVKQAEAEMHETEQIYKRVVEQATDLIYILDLEMRVVLLNPIAVKTFLKIGNYYGSGPADTSGSEKGKYSRFIGQRVFRLFSPLYEKFIKKQIEISIKHQIVHSFEHMLTLQDRKIQYNSKLIPIRDENNEIIHILGISRDVTEKLEMDQKIYNTEKLASIGTLAAGVAHELNNPLGAILGFTDLLMERFQEGTQEKDDLKIIENSASHAKKIVENLLGFARITEGLEDYVDINESLDTVINIVRNTLMTKKIDFVLKVDNNLPSAKCDPREFQQIIFNLINNSVAAMHGAGGTLTIIAYPSDEWVFIKVIDTGVGIPDDLKARIFDPFFTTKKVGEGTGLGLSLCYGIARKSGGTITFNSISSENANDDFTGTTFILSLPVYRKEKQNRNTQGENK